MVLNTLTRKNNCTVLWQEALFGSAFVGPSSLINCGSKQGPDFSISMPFGGQVGSQHFENPTTATSLHEVVSTFLT